MATFTVTSTQDSGAGSLRDAVLAANAAAGADTIVFSSDFDGGSEDLIRLTSGQIEIIDELTITGGPAGVTITGDANGDDIVAPGAITDVAASLEGGDRLKDNSRIFDSTADLTIDGLTLTGGRTMADSEFGGAVRSWTAVALTNSTVSGNSTAGYFSLGGGIFGVDVRLTNSTVSDNSTAGERSYGGGIWGADVTLTNSTVSGNSTAGYSSNAGGIFGGIVTLTNSTISGNSTAGDFSRGGGIHASNVTLTNSTVSGNSTAGDNSEGGGVIGWGYVTLTNSIVQGNATLFAGVDDDEVEGGPTLIGGNILGGDLFDGDEDVGDVTVDEVFAETTEIAPGVFAGTLADNGGPTRTILIEADGPAVDAGGAMALPMIDQRGMERVFGAAVDLGAVELGAGPAEPGSLVVTTALDVVATDGLTSLREAVSFANVELGMDTITFDASAFDGEACDVIRLTGGQIDITEALAITGGAAGVTITGDANGDDVTLAGGITDVDASGDARLADNSRLFSATAALTLDRLTLTGGRTESSQGGAVAGMTVALTNSTVSGNSTVGDYSGGGGIAGLYVTLTNSTVSGNSTAGYLSTGGGIAGGYVTLINSTVNGNSTAGRRSQGGGIAGGDYVTLISSTVSGNVTECGLGGAAIYTQLTATLVNSTVTGNSDIGSNYYGVNEGPIVVDPSRDGFVSLTNSIVLGNAGGGGDRIRGVSQGGANIIGTTLFDGTETSDVTAAEVFAATTEIAPGVFAGVLADNGGPTRTIAIRPDGPAAGAADPATATAADQRGVERDDAPDLGAYEAEAESGLKLVGGPGADVLVGGAGDDRICGRAGNDLLRGLAGDDLLRGGRGCDTLKGGAGEDDLDGGRGRDRIGGGTGDDTLAGGKGCDVFVFGRDFGDDEIRDFDANPRCGQDRIDLRGLGISAASFAEAVTIEETGDDTRIFVDGQGSMTCRGLDAISQSDFLLLT